MQRKPEWASLSAQARVYLAAGAWRSAHDLLWTPLQSHWHAPPPEALECACLLMGACSRLKHDEHLEQGCRTLEKALAEGVVLPPEATVLATLSLALQQVRQGCYAAARARLTALPEKVAAQAGPWTRARVALLRARIESVDGHDDAAERFALEAAHLAARAGSESLRGDALSVLAIIARRRGSLDEANALYAKSATHYWHTGDTAGQVRVVLNRGWILGQIGRMPESERLFEEALALATSLERRSTALRAQLGLGWVAARGGNLPDARRPLLAAWREARRLGLRREEALALQFLSEFYIFANAPRRARPALRLCQRQALRLAPEGDIALEASICAALLSLAEGDLKAAFSGARQAIRLARRTGMRWEEARAGRVLATAYLRAARRREARQAFRRALGLFEEIGENLERQVVEAWLAYLEQPPRRRAAGEPASVAPATPAIAFWLRHPLLGPQGKIEVSPGGAEVAVAAPGKEPSGIIAPEARLPERPLRSSHPIWASVGMVTRTPAVLRIQRLAETYAPGMIPVLVLGETGTGKDLLAQGIHALSGHPGRFVPVNCAAARKELFIAELFGARRGAYTGASEDRGGLIEEASGGTIFFDEIADLEPEAQGFLLRFLDSGEVRPLGSTRSRRVVTRVVAATCRDLPEMVRGQRFRADLYGRLAGLKLNIPPLRARGADLDLLVEMLWLRGGGALADYRTVFGPDLMARLRARAWPGNVRELKHTIDRALLFCRMHGPRETGAELLEWVAGMSREAPDQPETGLGNWEPAVLQDALRAAGGSIPGAARILGLSRSHAYRLYKKLKAGRGGAR